MKIPIASITFLIIFLISFWTLIEMHESAHVEIFREYDIDSSIEYWKGIFPYQTAAESNCQNENCRLAHNLNEVIGYQLQPFLILIGAGIFLIIFV